MEYRTAAALWLLAVVALAWNWQVKWERCRGQDLAQGAVAGLVFGAVLSPLGRRSHSLRNKWLLFAQQGSFLNRHGYAWACGIFLGSVAGFDYSVACEASKMNYLKFGIIASQAAVHFVVTVALIIGEVHFGFREMFVSAYGKKREKIDFVEFVLAMGCALVLADYAGIFSLIYFGFFLGIYYGVYQVYLWKPDWFIVGLVLLCVCNCLANAFRRIYLVPKLKKMREENEFRNVFPFGV
jgi:hypothetical protein